MINYADESQSLDEKSGSSYGDWLNPIERLAKIGTGIAGAFRGQSSAPAPQPTAAPASSLPAWVKPAAIVAAVLVGVALLVSFFRGR